MEQLFLKRFFSGTCTVREKNDVQLTFDESYLCYVRKINVFQCSFVLVFTNGTTFPSETFLWDLHIKKEK